MLREASSACTLMTWAISRRSLSVLFQCLHDVCLVRPAQIPDTALWIVIPVSWGIAFFEYCFAVPANRIGHQVYSAAQLKTMQEVITLIVFAIFSVTYLGESAEMESRRRLRPDRGGGLFRVSQILKAHPAARLTRGVRQSRRPAGSARGNALEVHRTAALHDVPTQLAADVGADIEFPSVIWLVFLSHSICGATPPGLRKVLPSKSNGRGATVSQAVARSAASRSRIC